MRIQTTLGMQVAITSRLHAVKWQVLSICKHLHLIIMAKVWIFVILVLCQLPDIFPAIPTERRLKRASASYVPTWLTTCSNPVECIYQITEFATYRYARRLSYIS